MRPAYGDGNTYGGECLCHGVDVVGAVARSRPDPFVTNTDPFGGKRVLAVMLSTATGAHDVPMSVLRIESSNPKENT